MQDSVVLVVPVWHIFKEFTKSFLILGTNVFKMCFADVVRQSHCKSSVALCLVLNVSTSKVESQIVKRTKSYNLRLMSLPVQ